MIQEAVIKYEDEKILRAIMAMGRELGFTVVPAKEVVTDSDNILDGDKDPSIYFKDLMDIFTGSNIDAKELRRSAWERKKVICDTNILLIDLFDRTGERFQCADSGDRHRDGSPPCLPTTPRISGS